MNGIKWSSFLVVVALILSLKVEHVKGQSECVNGEFNNETMTCQCYMGWGGSNCSTCRGRLRLTESSGVIADDATSGINYSDNAACLFHIQANKSVSSIHLKLHLLHLECQWDYLYVFDGDSIFSPKLASYTGDIIEAPPVSTNVNFTFNGTKSIPVPILNPQHTLSSSGSNILLYFYSDVHLTGPGFELAYWVDYECPDNCSARGVCNTVNGMCSCNVGWTGESCQFPVCPNNCSSKGRCNTDTSRCICDQGYQGEDCGVEVASAHWSVVNYTSTPPPNLARASHSAILWKDSMLMYGGYRFPNQSGYYESEEPEPGPLPNHLVGEVWRFYFGSRSWEMVNTSAADYRNLQEEENGSGSGGGNGSVTMIPHLPASRYGHSAVLFNNSMYLYGGSLYPSEVITSELWRLDLDTFQWIALSSNPVNVSVTGCLNLLPMPVRGHTAHAVGSKMVVLFGLSSGDDSSFPTFVQEYDLITGEWSVPPRRGVIVSGRMGHSSSYSPEQDLIYVYGGRGTASEFQDHLLTYNPTSYIWSSLTPSGSSRFLHSAVLLGPVLVSFGGCQDHNPNRDCFSHDLLLYNTYCDRWEQLELPGLPLDAGRFGHSSLLDPLDGSMLVFGGFVGAVRQDMLRLVPGDCSRWREEGDCINMSSWMCAWREGVCVSLLDVRRDDANSSSYSCAVDECLFHRTCPECSDSSDNCYWDLDSSRCLTRSTTFPVSSCPVSSLLLECSNLTSRLECQLQGCHWGKAVNADTMSCFDEGDLDDLSLNVSEIATCPGSSSSCFARGSCGDCTNGCLWCPSLSRCIPPRSYPVVFNFGQCLGWVQNSAGCGRAECQERTNCSSCQELPQCGWCNDLSDTGIGVCTTGGSSGPQDNESCLGMDHLGNQEEWFFHECAECQCNGHSTCVNGSVCEECMNNTTGANCESCSPGFFGNAGNGGSCAECECNGYGDRCDHLSGVCQCNTQGVEGDRCTICDSDYRGDTQNFCYDDLNIGFIYTFGVDSGHSQAFYAITPPKDESLSFRFEVISNPNGKSVVIQLFLGRKSENLWLLVNLTNRIVLPPLGSHSGDYDDFKSSTNRNDTSHIISFAHSSIRNSQNFSRLFEAAIPNDYTSRMWDDDVTLVLHISNLRNPTTYRITVDQQNYAFLLYFFATFIACFTILLAIFLLVWYIKRKITLRVLMRQQYIELQRRVARPFTKIKLAIDNGPTSTAPLPTEQKPSYVAVETCRDGKAAVLSLFVQLPRDHKTGRPSLGRTGLCLGSTLVSVNPSKKPKKKKEEGRSQELENTNSAIVHTGRARRRTRTDSTTLPPVSDA